MEVFPGTVLLVSHDRYLIEALAEQIWAISPDEKTLQVISGGYSAYVEHRQAQRTTENNMDPELTVPKRTARSASKLDLQKLEARIATLEAELESIAVEMDLFQGDAEKVIGLGERYAKVEQALDEALALWERAERELSSA
jgi:ATP-binding cassette subfamily F protein 3